MNKKKKQYYIANHKNTKFLCSTDYNLSSITYEFNKAMIFTNDVKPRQIVRLLPKSIQRYGPFEIHVIKDEDSIQNQSKTITTYSVENNIKTEQEKKEIEINNKKEFNYQEIKDELNLFGSKLKILINQQASLNDELSNIDLEISDILHYIEFHKFSACEGYKLAKMLQVARDKRRDIKNKLDIIRIFETYKCTAISSGTLVERMDGIDTRKYKPRILNELFENGKNKEREHSKL